MAQRVLLLLQLVGCCLAKTQDCSVERNTSCDSMGNATLDTAAFYEQYKDCNWSSRDKEDTVLKLITPAPNVNVQCILAEIRLKMQCDSPKRVEFMACYRFPTTGPNSAGEIHHQIHVAVIIPVYLCLWCWTCLP